MDKQIKHLVAIHVMGYTEENGMYSDNGGKTRYNLSYLPDYDKYVGSAWQVVEKLRGKHLKVYVETEFHYYEAYVKNGLGGYVTDCYTEDSLPKAICLAALEAVGVEIEQ